MTEGREIRLDQIGNAERLHRALKGTARYVAQWRQWLVYDCGQGRFVSDPGEVRMLEHAKLVRDELWIEAGRADVGDRKAIAAHAHRSGSTPALRGALELVRGMPGILVSPSDLDAEPALVNCANGTLDLENGALMEHSAGDLLTRSTRVAYRPDAGAPIFHSVLERALPDRDVRTFFQRAIGYSLLGRPIEHVLFMNIGSGANAKSTAMGVIQKALGDYAGIARKDLLIVTRHGEHTSSRTALEGRRLVTATEIDRNEALSESSVKELTGGDRISVRRMYGDPYEVDLTCTIWLSANVLPRVGGTDEGIWRRLRVIEWPVVIPAHERDPHLPEKLEDELEGVLAWMVEGHREWRRIGLAEPAGVVIATETYRAGEDVIGRFLDDSGLVVDPADRGLIITNPDLKKQLDAWCDDTGERVSQRRLSTELKRRGAVQERSSNLRRWRHVGWSVTDRDGVSGTSPHAHARSDSRGEPS